MDMFQIEGARPLRGKVRISGSKNGSLPLLAASLLTEETTEIHNVPDLRDIREMIRLMEHLGARVAFDRGTLTVDPSDVTVDNVPYEIMSRMRASFYAMGPLLARIGRARVSIPGGCAIGDRPVGIHLHGFEALGVQLSERQGYIHGRHQGLKGANLSLLGSNGTSVGATCNVMMVAVFAEGETVINDAAREPEVLELGRFLNTMGAQVEGLGTSTIRIKGVKKLHGISWNVSNDRIEAVTYAVATLITHGDVVLEGLSRSDVRPSLMALDQWGAELTWLDETSLRVTRGKAKKKPLQLVTEPYPGFPTDAQPQLTVLCALTPGESSIRDTIYPERFMHVAELKRLGARITQTGKGRIEINGVPAFEGAAVMSSDLRAGAALIVAALAAHGTSQVRRIYHVERGYENIVEKLKGLGASITRVSDKEPAPGLEGELFRSTSLEETDVPKPNH